jgi:hypothetical protein
MFKASIVEHDYMKEYNPDGPANHTDSNIVAHVYNNDEAMRGG